MGPLSRKKKPGIDVDKATTETGATQTPQMVEAINGATLIGIQADAAQVEQHANKPPEERAQEYKEAIKKVGGSKELQDEVSKNLTDQKTGPFDGFYATLRETYQKTTDTNTKSFLKSLEERFTSLTKQKSPEAQREQEALSTLMKLAPKLQEYNKAMYEAGYSDQQIKQFNIRLREEYVKAYTGARAEGLSVEDAAQKGKNAVDTRIKYQKAQYVRDNRLSRADAEKDTDLKQMDAASAFLAGSVIPQALAIHSGNAQAISDLDNATNREELEKAIQEHNLMSNTAVNEMFKSTDLALSNGLLIGLGELFDAGFDSEFGEAGAESGGAETAAAQAQMMRDIEDLAREDQERANEANKLIADLMEQAEESGEETTVGDLKDDELKERLEEMGVEQDKTIKEAIEFTNKTMETLAAQQGRVDELKQNAVEGLEPSFHTNPQKALEMNGIMKDGQLTEFGQSVIPDILKASGGSFNNALDQIMDAIPIEGREEFMDRVGEARLTINEYMADPGNAEKQKAAAEILANPEFVAVRAAFQEALADNAAEAIGKLNA